MPRKKSAAPSANSPSIAAPAPSPDPVVAAPTGAPPPVGDPALPEGHPLPAGDAGQNNSASDGAARELQTTEIPDPPPGGTLEQLETIDPSTGERAAPLIGREHLGAVAENASLSEPPLVGLAGLGDLQVERLTDPADDTFEGFVQALLETAAAALGVTLEQISAAARQVVFPEGSAPIDLAELGADASAARTPLPPLADEALADALDAVRVEARPLVMLGLPVLFREHERRFNGEPFTPAIITRVHAGDPDLSVNLMVLPDNGEPYPRLNVRYEAELDPAGLGRAWSHLKLPDPPDPD